MHTRRNVSYEQNCTISPLRACFLPAGSRLYLSPPAPARQSQANIFICIHLQLERKQGPAEGMTPIVHKTANIMMACTLLNNIVCLDIPMHAVTNIMPESHPSNAGLLKLLMRSFTEMEMSNNSWSTPSTHTDEGSSDAVQSCTSHRQH